MFAGTVRAESVHTVNAATSVLLFIAQVRNVSSMRPQTWCGRHPGEGRNRNPH